MGLFFDDPLFEEFTSWLALGLAPYGGGTLGEVRATCGSGRRSRPEPQPTR